MNGEYVSGCVGESRDGLRVPETFYDDELQSGVTVAAPGDDLNINTFSFPENTRYSVSCSTLLRIPGTGHCNCCIKSRIINNHHNENRRSVRE